MQGFEIFILLAKQLFGALAFRDVDDIKAQVIGVRNRVKRLLIPHIIDFQFAQQIVARVVLQVLGNRRKIGQQRVIGSIDTTFGEQPLPGRIHVMNKACEIDLDDWPRIEAWE